MLSKIIVSISVVLLSVGRGYGQDARLQPGDETSVTMSPLAAAAQSPAGHLGWKYSVIGYAIAGYVAASRLHDNDHWLSDVVFGSATGTIAGRTVVHHARDYWAFTPTPLPGGGVAIFVSRTPVAR